MGIFPEINQPAIGVAPHEPNPFRIVVLHDEPLKDLDPVFHLGHPDHLNQCGAREECLSVRPLKIRTFL